MKYMYYLIFLTELVIHVTCTPNTVQKKPLNSSNPNKNTGMHSEMIEKIVSITEAAFFPWNEKEGLPKITTGKPVTSKFIGPHDTSELIIAPYRYRLSQSGNEIIILANDPKFVTGNLSNTFFHILNLKNKYTYKIYPFLNSNNIIKLEIVDFFLLQNNNIFVLEKLLTKDNIIINQLRLIDPDSKTRWAISDSSDDKNKNQYSNIGNVKSIIRVLNGVLYIHTHISDFSKILYIDIEKGEVMSILNLDEKVEKVLLDDSLNLTYAHFIKQNNNRAILKNDLNTNKKSIQYANSLTYGFLGSLNNLDHAGNIYCSEGLTFASLTPTLEINWVLILNNLIKDSNYIYTSHFDESGQKVIIQKWHDSGDVSNKFYISLNLPEVRLGKLVEVKSPDKFIVEIFQGNTRRYYEYNLNIDKMNEVVSYKLNNMFNPQPANTWQIDGGGHLFVPISCPDGLRIFKISF